LLERSAIWLAPTSDVEDNSNQKKATSVPVQFTGDYLVYDDYLPVTRMVLSLPGKLSPFGSPCRLLDIFNNPDMPPVTDAFR
jgi:hypothetical protein